jgi:hypothetical protein
MNPVQPLPSTLFACWASGLTLHSGATGAPSTNPPNRRGFVEGCDSVPLTSTPRVCCDKTSAILTALVCVLLSGLAAYGLRKITVLRYGAIYGVTFMPI